MLGDIDYLKKPTKPQLFLGKPNKQIISKLSEAYDILQPMKLISINELSFKIPFEIEVNNELVRNKNVDLIKERYYVQVKVGNKSEWYMVMNINDSMDDGKDVKEVKCLALPNELNDKIIKGYSVASYQARQVLNDMLSGTIWTIGTLDADFELTYRSFEFNDTNALGAVFSIAETYNAVVEWDTNNRTVSFIKPEFHGLNKGLKFSYGKYLKNLGKESNANEMVTRLKPYGKDGLGIQRINPTGQNYLEDFSYFVYPFARDSSKNVITSSNYMSDSLCNALLDYKDKVESYAGSYGTFVANKDTLDNTLAQKNVELVNLKNELAAITDIQLVQQFDGVMFFEQFNYVGSTTIKTFPVDSFYQYAVLCKVGNTSGVSLSVNGTTSSLSSGNWVVCQKVNAGITPISVTVSGSASTSVFIQVVNINSTEFATSGNNAAIIEKYNYDNKQMQINAKQTEINVVQTQINSAVTSINNIQSILSVDNNFTVAQKNELNLYIIEREFSDEKYVLDTDLNDAAKKHFDELKVPQVAFKIGIVDFLQVVEEQGNWDKLVLGDKVFIQYDKFDVKVEAKIIEMDFDYENANVTLTIAFLRDLATGRRNFEKYIYDSKNTTSIVDFNKYKWSQAVVDTSDMSKLFDNFWNKVTNEINMASNEYVTIDRKGITDIDPSDPLRFIRITHGAIGLTRSGGLRYETAMTADGIIAERLMGKILLTQRVVIGDDDGIWLTEGAKTTITDRCGREVMKIGLYAENPDKFGIILNRYDPSVACSPTIVNKIIMDESDGFKLQRKKGTLFDDVFYTSLDGDLFMKGNFQAGEGEQIFKVTHTGLQLGGSVWDTAPLHADMFGNVWMSKLFADDAEITSSLFQGGHIIGSDLTLGTGNQVIKLFPNIGLWAGDADFADAPFSVSMDGKIKLKGKGGSLFIDTEANVMNLYSMDIVGAGAIIAEYILANSFVVGEGIISNLSVNKLKTLGQQDAIGDVANYIDIKDNLARWITGTITGRTQAATKKGDLLYWTDATKAGMTTTSTAYPIWNLTIDESEKISISHETGTNAAPYIKMGVGDKVTQLSGKAKISKPNGELDLIYYRSNNELQRRLILKDAGIDLFSDTGDITIGNGSSSITIKANGDIELTATGQIKLNGTQIHLN